ncbi:MAG: redoxin domain-containing protein [Candidatus Coatesbacteria bacterium]|nr:MAG: redoxin domain-containing protein [Candidatus Coatesbacteria bacterium]
MRLINKALVVVVLVSSTCWAADKPPTEMTPEELAAAIQGAVEREQYEELITVAWEKYPYHPALAPFTFSDAYFAGDLERALEVVEEVLKIEPDNAEWISSRAILLFDLERFAEAENAVREALDAGALPPVANVYLGYIELTKDEPDLERAKEYYELGLADVQAGQEGELLGSFYDLASVYARLGDLDAALENLERVLNIEPAFIEEAAEDPNLETLRDDPRYAELAADAEAGIADFIASYATVPPGEPAPEFVLLDVDGDTVMLSDYAGKVVLVNFWATWCPPCRAEIPDIAELYVDYRDKGLVVLGISLDEITDEFTVDDLAATSTELGVNYPVLLGTESVAEAYISKAGGIPETYIVDQFGTVVEFVYGMTDEETLERKILKDLPE